MDQSPCFSGLLTLTAQQGSGTPFCGPPKQRSRERGGRGPTVRGALAAARLLKPRRNKVIVRNVDHVDDEIDLVGSTGLEGMQVDIIKPQAGPFGFFDGHGEIALAMGRPHDVGRATDHPSVNELRDEIHVRQRVRLPSLDQRRHHARD